MSALSTVSSATSSQPTWMSSQEHALQKMIAVEDRQFICKLDQNVFDPSLWRELMNRGATAHHDLLLAELIPGYLWVQHGLVGPAIHWVSQAGKTIYRATYFEEQILVVSYSLQQNRAQTAKRSFLSEEFQAVIHAYLEECKAIPEVQPIRERAFQKCLEIIPIRCKVSQQATQKFKELQASNPNQTLTLSVLFGLNAAQKPYSSVLNQGSTLLEVSKRFLIDRLISHVNLVKDEMYVAYTAPVIRSWEAFKKIEEESVQAAGALDAERRVHDHTNLPKERLQLTNLKPLLFIQQGEDRQEHEAEPERDGHR